METGWAVDASARSRRSVFITSFSPTVFYFDLTFRVITMLVIGGMGSVSGSIIGAILIVVSDPDVLATFRYFTARPSDTQR